MNFKGLVIFVGLAITIAACSQSGLENVKLENKDDSLAYSIGITNYASLAQEGLELDPLILAKAMIDAKEGKSLINETAARGYIQLYFEKLRESEMKEMEEEMKEQYKDVVEMNEKFLAENKEKEGINTTASGLQYKVVKMGDGPKPIATDKVKVHYTGTLVDGTKFDSSVDRGEPAEFNVNQVIKGWIEGLQLMPVGSTFMFYIPSDLAYGSQSAGEVIKPFSALIFEVQLLDIITP